MHNALGDPLHVAQKGCAVHAAANNVILPDNSPTAGFEQGPFEDEMAEYLKLPQIEGEDDWAPLEWWCANKKRFPNLARMARQYLGCPATSATVERLFSAVGLAFSDQRKSSSADTLADIAFTKLNLD